MALIDLTLEKPALKRTEHVARESGDGTESESLDLEDATPSSRETRPMEIDETAGGGRSKGKALGLVLATVLGALAFRKLRSRRRDDSDGA